MDEEQLSKASSGNADSPIMLTWQSNQHAQNQDRAFYYSSFPTRQTLDITDPTFLVGLFDGHGVDGHFMAAFVQQHLADVLALKLNSRPCCQSDDWIKEQLNATFLELEAQAVALSPTQDFAYRGGCTASVTLRLGDRLFFANAGDSRTMLASDFTRTQVEADPYSVDVTYSTRLDKADLPDERARIEALGGRIFIPPNNGAYQTSRVVLYSHHLKDREV